ncbi:hypothetical protein [Paenibacillus solani]|uniref:hypothetical protein n=1 Tax=Paenibacillus solani TaxID=1705565 RepID=UPI003D2B8968
MRSELEQDIISTAESFQNNFSDRGNLDFSIESLQVVEDILDELCDYELEEDHVNSVSSMVGCYIMEIARRQHGGKYYWSEERNQPVFVTGEPDFSISILAFDKVRGRILNGAEDHIPFYFEGYMQAVIKGKENGYCATIV